MKTKKEILKDCIDYVIEETSLDFTDDKKEKYINNSDLLSELENLFDRVFEELEDELYSEN